MPTTPEKNYKDPFRATNPIPVPTELSLESGSGTPTYAFERNAQTTLPAEPLHSPVAHNTPAQNTTAQNPAQIHGISTSATAPTSQFIEDLDVALSQWTFGLNWRRTTVTKAGIINKLIGKKQLIDLDLSCILFDSRGDIVERVWFKNVRDNAQSVRHRGDSLDGTDRGDNLTFDNRLDQEKIDVLFDKIPPHIHFIAFVLSSYHGQPFASISDGYCHISDDEGNVITQLNLPKLPKKCKAIWVATLAREVDTWQFTANHQPLNHYCLAQFEQEIAQYFSKIQQAKIVTSPV